MVKNKPHQTEPHGGKLIDLMVDEKQGAKLKEVALNLPDVILADRQLCDIELLTNGTFSPLQGFMCQVDYEAVLDRMRLQNGLLWSLPICLDIAEVQARTFECGQSIALRDVEGFLLAVMHVEDIWPIDKDKEARLVFGTRKQEHPGVNILYNKTGDYYIGGRLEVISTPVHYDSKQLRHTPLEIRRIARKMGWQRMVGFETRHPIHRPQFEMTIRAMRKAKANLLLLPIEDITAPGDFNHHTQIRCYRAIAKHYPPDAVILNLLSLSMRMAGHRDALLHAIVAKNLGCTHFIVGRNHAAPETNGKKSDRFYPVDGAWQLTKKHSNEVGIDILPFEDMVYLPFEEEYRPIPEVPKGTQTIQFSGNEIRRRIRAGKKIPHWATFPEVLDELHRDFPPPSKQGFTIFLTGLSGSGKSTIAKVLYAGFQEIGNRPVTLLDGDVVRRNLSSQLSFSKEHRDINVRRIGFVAAEITKNRGVAICAPIAPYQTTRREIRSSIEKYGKFIEVHVATPLEVCEKRDRKGMYAKARAGLIKGFTGVDDPYEAPQSPELRIDTSNITPEEASQEIYLYLGQWGYI